jgi:two-component system LytT family sensor kinase
VFALALLFWSLIELWGYGLNLLVGILPRPALLPGQMAGIVEAGLISTLGWKIVRRSAAGSLRRRLFVGATASVASSSIYACGMIVLAEWMPIAGPPRAEGLVRFAYDALFFLVPFGLWTAVAIALESSRLGSERDARRSEALVAAREAEVRALHYQINPHLLYNSLNSLSTLILEGRVEQADNMVHQLAAFFRSNLTADPLNDVPLAAEVCNQLLYLRLEELRFGGRLKVAVDIPEALGAHLVPSLILQPLVENAVKHGVHEPGRDTRITITAGPQSGGLFIEVRDNGPGGVVAPGTGIGLENVRKRLTARYGEKASLQVGRQGDGFVARLELRT